MFARRTSTVNSFFLTILQAPRSTLFPYTTLFRSHTAAYLNLADLLRSQGREKAAERLLRDGLALMPKEGVLHYALGLSLRSEEHTSELQSRPHLVCRLLLEKKKR